MARKITAPKGLSRQSATWFRTIARDYDICEQHSLTLLESAARTLDDVAEMEAVVKKEGRSVKDRYGVPKAHPLLTEIRGSRNLLRLTLRELCLDEGVTAGNEAEFRPPRLRVG